MVARKKLYFTKYANLAVQNSSPTDKKEYGTT